ncbi:hypothetical protein PROFUN_13961 [Planoprotostelium fungivorum]|uniref:Uncharacterized protein n=1 Tax=Planoprotostelium fungivorum TaxID=1890364 RepID=A0A2P6N2M1_9EUKA|nr:hypothetical protein PROFUN_13961 [Planoprotostelium fungivorum]
MGALSLLRIQKSQRNLTKKLSDSNESRVVSYEHPLPFRAKRMKSADPQITDAL